MLLVYLFGAVALLLKASESRRAQFNITHVREFDPASARREQPSILSLVWQDSPLLNSLFVGLMAYTVWPP